MTVKPLPARSLRYSSTSLRIGPLKEQPASVAEVKERLAVLVHEVSPVWADLEFDVLNGACGCIVRGGCVATSQCQQRRRQGVECLGTDKACGCFHDRVLLFLSMEVKHRAAC